MKKFYVLFICIIILTVGGLIMLQQDALHDIQVDRVSSDPFNQQSYVTLDFGDDDDPEIIDIGFGQDNDPEIMVDLNAFHLNNLLSEKTTF